MRTVLFFVYSNKYICANRIDGIRRYAEKARWRIQVIERNGGGHALDVKGIVDFWSPIGVIAECGGGMPEISRRTLGDLPVVYLDNDYDLSMRRDAINNSSICYRVTNAGKSILVTGDVSVEMGAKMVRTLPPEKLKSDVCFMAHHGQAGADKAFYVAVRPEVCIWPTPQWLWDNDFGGTHGPGSGEFLTNYVKCWMQDLGVKRQILLVRDWRMV